MTSHLRIAYAGTPEFAVPALASLLDSDHEIVAVLTQPDRKSGRGRKISQSAVKQKITSENIHILQPSEVNSEELIKELCSLNLDLIVVAAYGQIFSQNLLGLPRLGCINIHASLLPKWRGASPIQHAILSGDQCSGVTIMQMAKAMDAGDIWSQASCDITDQDTSESLHNKLAKLGGEIILPTIEKVNDVGEKPVPQDENEATYCSKLKKSDGLIKWQEPAQRISRQIRAYHPWPGAYTTLNGRRLRITQAELIDDIRAQLQPGYIYEVSKNGFSVAAANGTAIKIKQLIPEGGKRISAVDFSNSNVLINQLLN